MNSVVSLNDEGAAYLRAENYDAAIASFTSAMKRLRRVQSDVHDANILTMGGPDASIMPVLKPPVTDDHEQHVSEAGNAIYGRPFGLTVHQEAAALSSMDLHHSTTALLFNFALSYHLRSVNAHDSSRFLDTKRAKRLYKVGVQAFFVMVQSCPGPLHPSVCPLLSVLSNNLGCIAMEEYDYDTVEHCIEWTRLEDIPDDAPVILLNQMTWGTFKSNPAPAA